jgi:hypothetical protein
VAGVFFVFTISLLASLAAPLVGFALSHLPVLTQILKTHILHPTRVLRNQNALVLIEYSFPGSYDWLCAVQSH